MKQFLEIGRIVKTHGLIGEVKVEHWCDNSCVLKKIKSIYLLKNNVNFKKVFYKQNVTSIKLNEKFVIFKIDTINSKEAANNLINEILFVQRSQLKISSHRFFIQDIIGCDVFDVSKNNQFIGKVVNVLNYGANDIYEIKCDFKKNILIPVIDEVVIHKNLQNKKIYIKPMEGLFDV